MLLIIKIFSVIKINACIRLGIISGISIDFLLFQVWLILFVSEHSDVIWSTLSVFFISAPLNMYMYLVILNLAIRDVLGLENCTNPLITCSLYCCYKRGEPSGERCCNVCNDSIYQKTRETCGKDGNDNDDIATLNASILFIVIVVNIVVLICIHCCYGRRLPSRPVIS